MQFEKTTFKYLQELHKNNNRDWFSEHKETYLKAQQNAKEVFEEVNQNLQKHDEIEKSKMMRIYRDVRFSKDKTPYKAHFANSFSRLGKELRGGYFIKIKNILKDKNYKKYFGGKFESLSELKTAPRGFDKEHPDVNLLRKKGFIASRKFSDAEVLSPDFVNCVDESFKALRPFFNLFSDILTTNLNGEQLI
jgi:uncharacterized protein (DUF2461 family)